MMNCNSLIQRMMSIIIIMNDVTTFKSVIRIKFGHPHNMGVTTPTIQISYYPYLVVLDFFINLYLLLTVIEIIV